MKNIGSAMKTTPSGRSRASELKTPSRSSALFTSTRRSLTRNDRAGVSSAFSAGACAELGGCPTTAKWAESGQIKCGGGVGPENSDAWHLPPRLRLGDERRGEEGASQGAEECSSVDYGPPLAGATA